MHYVDVIHLRRPRSALLYASMAYILVVVLVIMKMSDKVLV